MTNFFTLLFNIKTYHPETSSFNDKVLINREEDYKAPDKCVDAIMDFARSYRVADTKSTGKVELMLN
jgi:hypothetical protein